MSDPERSPLLARNSVRFYTSDDVINDGENLSEPEATRPGAGACRSWVSAADSDAEYMSSASRSHIRSHVLLADSFCPQVE